MNVKELIERLREFDEDMPVVVLGDDDDFIEIDDISSFEAHNLPGQKSYYWRKGRVRGGWPPSKKVLCVG